MRTSLNQLAWYRQTPRRTEIEYWNTSKIDVFRIRILPSENFADFSQRKAHVF